jgi:hypothetical protein
MIMRNETTRNETLKRSVAIAIAAIITLGATIPLSAAPMLSNTADMKATLSNSVTDVRYFHRGHYRGGYGYGYGVPAIAGGLALGIIGATIGQGYYGDEYYAPGYRPGYRPGYESGYGPAYYPYGHNAY